MRAFAFKRMREGGLDEQFPQYLVQGAVYCKGLGRKGVKFLCLDKDDSRIESITFEADALEPYWNWAVAAALKIQSWLPLKRLPGREISLPPWYCSAAYCHLAECRYNFANPKKLEWKRRK